MESYCLGKIATSKIQFTVNTDVEMLPNASKKNLERFAVKQPTHQQISRISISMPIPEWIKQKNQRMGMEESFAIERKKTEIVVHAGDYRGQLYGLMSFLRLLDEEGCFGYELVCDVPVSSFRGVKLMMPGREEIEHFKNFIDVMLYFRHNTLMLEIGGGMEYKRHPEINEGWEEYALFMSESSGKAKIIQEHTYPWRKNSIHCNNGGGSYLTQAEVKELIEYCAERGIEIIPEVPATSHCDYLLTRHPELAERCEDPYPDTFCPSNPASYELLFDVLDEVVEVFHPQMINIGHDEYYSINICDRCRKRRLSNYEIYAEDVTKIHDFLMSKGVKTMIWCDKLMNVETEDGQNFGGAINYVYQEWDPKKELLAVISPTWQARDMIPRDVICMNWLWSYGEIHDREIAKFSVVFGNFTGYNISSYHKRCGNNVSGGMCSNWGGTNPVYLQRNGIYISLAYNDCLFWNKTYNDTDDTQFQVVLDRCFRLLFDYHYGVPQNRIGHYVEVFHTAQEDIPYEDFVDGVLAEGKAYHEKYDLGYYRITYSDGTQDVQNVIWGENIGFDAVQWYGEQVTTAGSDAAPGVRSTRLLPQLAQMAYTTLPVLTDGKVYYQCLLKKSNDREIEKIEFIPNQNQTCKVDNLQIRTI